MTTNETRSMPGENAVLSGGNGRLEVRLFGGFDLRDGTGRRLPIRSRAGLHIFAYLFVQRIQGVQAVERLTLARLFWGGDDNCALESLKKCLQDLVSNLGPYAGLLDRSGPISLDLSSDGMTAAGMSGEPFRIWCDYAEFSQLAARDDEESLRQAVRLYTAPLLSEWSGGGGGGTGGIGDDMGVWKTPRKRAERIYLEALRGLAARLAARGDWHEAAGLVEQYVTVRPEEERGWQLLVSYWDAAGERYLAAEARERYADWLRQHRRRLPDGLRMPAAGEGGVAPAPPGGPVPLDSPYYVERAPDTLLRRALLRFEGIVRIKGPRYSGKSSLMARGVRYSREMGCRVVTTDFELFGESEMETLPAFCRSVVAQLSEVSGTPLPARRSTGGQAGSSLHNFLRWGLLADENSPRIVWAMDNVDRIFACPWREDFFRLLRSWHNLRATQPDQPWGRLCQLIVCSMEARLYLSDLNQSPFNTSEQVDAGDFDSEQIQILDNKWGNPLSILDESGNDSSRPPSAAFLEAAGGHPYLIQLGLYALAIEKTPLADLLAAWEMGEGPIGDHLRSLSRIVAGSAELRAAVAAVLRGQPCEEEAFLRLRSAGLLAGPHAGEPRFRCGLYQRYLSARIMPV